MKKAWIENNQIRDIAPGNPNELYHPDLAQYYDTDVPDNAENGDGWDGVTLTKPVIVIPEPVPEVVVPPTISTVAFRNLFTISEEIAITTSTDPVVKVLWSRFADPKLINVDMSLKSVGDALAYMTTIGILSSGREAEILTGKVT